MRLTKKDKYGHFYTNQANCRNIWSLDGKKLEGEYFENKTLAIDGKAIDKLGELEDIEKELGVEIKTIYEKIKNANDIFNKNGLTTNTITFTLFGKTWGLVREELENDKERI